MSLLNPRSAQKPFTMSPHKGLLHDITHAAETLAPHIAEIVGNTTVQNDTASANSTESHGSENQGEAHGTIYYLSRAYPLICLAVVLLLAFFRGVTAIRHWRRVRRRRIATQNENVLHASHPVGPYTDTIEGNPAPSTHSTHSGSADGTYVGSESTLVEPLTKAGSDGAHLEVGSPISGRRARKGRIGRYWSAWEAVYRNWMYLRTVPSWLYGPDTMADALWTVGYSAVLIAFAVASIPGEFGYCSLHLPRRLFPFCSSYEFVFG